MEASNCIGKFHIGENIELVGRFDEFLDKKFLMHPKLLVEMRKPEYYNELIKKNTLLTKKLISESVNDDTMIIQAVSALDEIEKVCNTLSKRLREWYGYYLPEYAPEEHEAFITNILHSSIDELKKEHHIENSMGGVVNEENNAAIMSMARSVQDLFSEKNKIVTYIESMSSKYPNLFSMTGAVLGARLIQRAGSLKHLSRMPSSTIQMLGAEKALFRHLRNRKARPPKHGYILSHSYVLNAPRREKGRHARILAGKIAIAVKIDYFKGEFIGDKLNEALK